MKTLLIFVLGCIGFLLFGCGSNDNPSTPVISSVTVSEGPSNATKPENDTPPTPAVADPSVLWPPNQKIITVNFEGMVITPGSFTLTDEYGEFSYTGTLLPGSYTVSLDLKAYRLPKDVNGRAYTFTVTTSGGSSSTVVLCPHDNGK